MHGVRPDAVSFGWAMSICANATDVTMTQQLVRRLCFDRSSSAACHAA